MGTFLRWQRLVLNYYSRVLSGVWILNCSACKQYYTCFSLIYEENYLVSFNMD